MAVRPAIVREVKHGRGLMELRGKLALVTGGSDGIGREIALQLQGAGAEVIVTGRSAEKLRAMAGLGFETVASDLSTPAGIDAVIDGVAGKPLALLVNNAGVGSEYELDRPETLGRAEHFISTNLDGAIHTLHRPRPGLCVLPGWKVVGEGKGCADSC